MQLYILDKDPTKSAQLIPDKYKFKMLIELGQLICSAGLSSVYKPIAQGKELQQWIKDNLGYTLKYYDELLHWTSLNINYKPETMYKLKGIFGGLYLAVGMHRPKITEHNIIPTHAYFRYASTYECSIPSKTLLPIEVCIEAYKEYLQWKMKG